nr:hypothetical protein [Tanacetum cinerariifolium]
MKETASNSKIIVKEDVVAQLIKDLLEGNILWVLKMKHIKLARTEPGGVPEAGRTHI